MPAIDTPKLYRASKAKTLNVLAQPFKVVHQRVSVDVDLANQAIAGTTEVVIVPYTDKLKVVKFDCREMAIEEVTVNNGKPCNFIYDDDLYINDESYFEALVERGTVNLFDLYLEDFTIHHSHLLRRKLAKVFGEVNFDPRELQQHQQQLTQQLLTQETPLAQQQQQVQLQLQQQQQHFLSQYTTAHTNTEELAVFLPDLLRFELADSSLTPMLVAGTTPMKKNTHNDSYAPITIRIRFSLVNPKNGVIFATSDPDPSRWHCYTTNTDFNVSTSLWVPCIDNLWERCTWLVELSVPRSLRQDDEAKDDDDDEESGDLDVVVCCGDANNVKETPHPLDPAKKIVLWLVFNPVCAQHLGWAYGCFSSFVLKAEEAPEPVEEAVIDDDSDDDDEGRKVEAVLIPVTVYCLAHQLEWARNTCVVLNRALDYFSREFGSFPFSLYLIVFVDHSPEPAHNFAGLSVMSTDVLYPSDVIEPMLELTEAVVEAIATQWLGINIVPHSFNDLWCTVGIARYMMLQYLKVLMGNNEYKFRVKMAVEEICAKDVNRKPLALQFFRFPVRMSNEDLWFIRLKAPIVMVCLDRRMTKTDKLFGLSRVLPKLFLQAMLGDLVNGSVLTQHFQYVCEKVNRTNKLEGFFKQWIYGAGTPRFYVTQRFNKKRFLIEMNIRQVQTKEVSKYKPTPQNFVADGLAYLDDEPQFPTQAVFTGPMTIRVHEQDGTPYEHIVDLKEANTRIDIQYNTKMRRKMKLRKKGDDDEEEEAPPPQYGAQFTPLGSQVLQSPQEMAEWGFENWTKTEEEVFDNAFEWVRVDADLEWIAQFEIKKPDYMYGAQLSYDRDVEAQYDAIRYFSHSQRPLPQVYALLTRTLMDDAYYYGVRIAAARALVAISNEGNQFLGVGYMINAYKAMFCYPGSLIPKLNDFTDFPRFFVQLRLPQILASVRTDAGEVPKPIRNLLYNLVKYNDNSNNPFLDLFYVTELLAALTQLAFPPALPDAHDTLKWLTEPTPGIILKDHEQFVANVDTEIVRLQKLDEWIPLFHHVMLAQCLRQRVELAVRGLVSLSIEDLLFYTPAKYPAPVRIEAWRGVFLLGGLKNAAVLNYFCKCVLLASDANATTNRQFQTELVEGLLKAIAIAAIDGTRLTLDDPEFGTLTKLALAPKTTTEVLDLVVIDDGLAAAKGSRRRDELARALIKGVINMLRRDYGPGLGLRHTLWELVHSSLMPLHLRRDVLNMCQLLYPAHEDYIVRLPVPLMPVSEFKKKIVARNLGDGQVVIKREGRFKIQFLLRKPTSTLTIKLRGSLTPSGGVAASTAPPQPTLSREERALLREAHLNRQAPQAIAAVGPRKVAVNGTTVSFRLTRDQLKNVMPQTGVAVSRVDPTTVLFKFQGKLAQLFKKKVTPRLVRINLKQGTVEVKRATSEEIQDEIKSNGDAIADHSSGDANGEVSEVGEAEQTQTNGEADKVNEEDANGDGVKETDGSNDEVIGNAGDAGNNDTNELGNGATDGGNNGANGDVDEDVAMTEAVGETKDVDEPLKFNTDQPAQNGNDVDDNGDVEMKDEQTTAHDNADNGEVQEKSPKDGTSETKPKITLKFNLK